MTSTDSATAKSLNPEDHYLWSTKVMMPISPQLETPESLAIKNPSSRGVVMGYILHPNSFMPVDKLILPIDPLHTVILGATGSGKSIALRTMAKAYNDTDYTVSILDWHGEHHIKGFIRVKPVNAKAPILGFEHKYLVQLLENYTLLHMGLRTFPINGRNTL